MTQKTRFLTWSCFAVTNQFVDLLFVAVNSSHSLRRVTFRRVFIWSHVQLVVYLLVAFYPSHDLVLVRALSL